MRRSPLAAVEIDDDDAAWLRGAELPDGAELVETDEVEFWGRTFDRAPDSALYVPTAEDATDRVIARRMRELQDQAEDDKPIGVSLFTGAGGFDLGLHALDEVLLWQADA